MNGSINRTMKLLSGVLILILLAACGGGGDGGTTVTSMGSLSVSLTDSSTEDYQAVYVTIDRVEVHSDSGSWQTVATPGTTYNLLELVNNVREDLGIAFLDSGHYTQLRMILGDQPDGGLNILGLHHQFANYLIDLTDTIHELKVPSGLRTGIKVVQGFDINENQTTELILDFDAAKSIVIAGNSGMHLLKPTIKLLRTVDAAIVTGLVSDAGSGPPVIGIEGALISAQVDNRVTSDAKDRVSVERSTIAAADDDQTAEIETGRYALLLPAGDYNLVAYFTGFEPLCHEISLAAGSTTADADFSLTAALTGTVQGTVDIIGAVADQHVTIDFRQAGLCTVLTKVVSVKTVEVENGGSYSVELPAGTYQVVSSTPGKATQSMDVIVTHNVTTQHNLAFP